MTMTSISVRRSAGIIRRGCGSGGLLGAVVVLMTSWLSPQLGTGLTVLVVLVVLIGQVTGGL